MYLCVFDDIYRRSRLARARFVCRRWMAGPDLRLRGCGSLLATTVIFGMIYGVMLEATGLVFAACSVKRRGGRSCFRDVNSVEGCVETRPHFDVRT